MTVDDADLVGVVVKQLDRLQHDIRHDGAFHELLNEAHGTDPSPMTEHDISDWVRRRLNDRLHDGVVVDREVQVQRLSSRGVGTRIDLLPSAGTISGPLARVVVEAKRVDNREVMTAMNEQLVDRYLASMSHRHGIFVVYWVRPDQRPGGWSRSQATDVVELTS